MQNIEPQGTKKTTENKHCLGIFEDSMVIFL